MKKQILVIGLLLFVFPCLGWSATYYVSQSSAGNGSGSSYSNRMSVNNHNSRSFSAGDIIYLCGSITSKVVVPSSGTSRNYITYKGNYAGHPVVMSNSSSRSTFFFDHVDYVILEDCELDGNNGSGTYGVGVDGVHHIIIRRNTIHDFATKGVGDSYDYSYDITVGGAEGDGNDIYNCGENTAGTDVVMNRTIGGLISYNKLYATSTNFGIDGVALLYCQNITVEYNTIYSHNHSGGDHGEDGIDLKQNNSGIIVRFNHIYDHQYQSGITVQMGTHDTQIYGNNIHDNHWAGVYIKRGSEGSDNMNNIDVWANLIYRNSSGVFVDSSGSMRGTLNDVGIYNNVFAENGDESGTSSSRGGVGIMYGSGHIVKNNIFYKNHGKYGGNMYEQVYLYNNSAATFDYNNYYYPGVSGRDMFYVAGAKRLREFKSLGQETHGAERDPKFTDAGRNNYTLASDSPCIDSGTNLNTTFAGVIDPNQTNFNAFPPLVGIANQGDYGSWERGAYIYGGQSDGQSLSPPLGLKIK